HQRHHAGGRDTAGGAPGSQRAGEWRYLMQVDLRGRRVVITGGTGGLGSAVVELFESAGAICEVTTRGNGEVARPRVTFHAIDVTDEKAVSDFYGKFADLWGSVHLVGAFTMSPVEKTSADDMLKMFRANTLSCFLC